jgi:pyridoxamine 5'-phosphate oxidase
MNPPDNLDAVADDLWRRLDEATKHPASPFTTPALALVDRIRPTIRTVVLRDVLRERRTLIAYTDTRSPKMSQLAASADSAWLFYHPQIQMQIRINGPITIHTDSALAQAHWIKSRLSSRRCFLGLAPGSALENPGSGLPSDLDGRVPSEEEANLARHRFALLCVEVTRIDWLWLHPQGHRRALFNWHDDRWSGRWLAP